MTKDQKLRVLFFGDIVGRPGRQAIARALPEIKKQHSPDVLLANVENIAHGKGVTPKTLNFLTDLGFDGFTAGEHIYDKAKDADLVEMFETFPNLVKPANYLPEQTGRGEVLLETGKGKILLINLLGQVFMRPKDTESPWKALSDILIKYRDEKLIAILVDLHAEATSEKIAMGLHFDGQITALLGTHTHVPTADAQVLPQGTAYITDVGMNGPADSVLGMAKEVSINRFLTDKPLPYEIAESDTVQLNYVIIDIDSFTQKALSIKHFQQLIEI